MSRLFCATDNHKQKLNIMKRFKPILIAALGTMMLWGNTQTGAAQEVDRAKYPDYIPFDASRQKTMPVKANRGNAKSMNRGQRPDHINNALSMYYPPIFNQSGGSCGSAQALGYMFTHEMNSWRNKDASFEENQYPTHFTWLFTTPGVEKIRIMTSNGIPNVPTYGGRTYSRTFGYQDTDHNYFGWMQGYDKWYSAMFNRSKRFFFGPRVSKDDEATQEELKQWLWNRWGTEGYNDGGVAGFGVASGGTWGRVPSTPTNNAIGVANTYCVKNWGTVYNHGMTIVGYDDRIEFDIDSNGVYGEKEKNELGAWIICNSWGNWLNQGFIYCPYAFTYCVYENGALKLDWATELYEHRPDFEPQRTIKLLMDYDHRWELKLSAGIASDTSATKPEATADFVHFSGTTAYDVDGKSPAVPMLGKWADGMHYEPMEFGYDLTDLGERFDKSKPLKYFFFVNTRTGGIGKGHLYKASIMNYEFDRENPIEIPFDIDTIEINGGEATLCVSVVVPGEAINPPLNAALNETILSWTSPAATTLPLDKYYIYSGNTLTDSISAKDNKYTVKNRDGIYSVAATYKYNDRILVSEKSNTASNPLIIDNKENKVLQLDQNGITIPNAITKDCPQATVEFMVKVKSLGGSLNKMGNPDNNFFINISASGQVSAGWSTKNAYDFANTAAGAIKANRWYHVAVVVDGSTLSIYVDGMKKKTVTSSSYNGIPAIGDFNIGLAGGLMNATIDEFRIWNTARTMSDIYGGKDEAISNPAALNDLIAYLPMNLIDDNGETKVREYAMTNHAYFDNDNYAQATDVTILKGSKLSSTMSIQCENDSIEAGTPVKFHATSPLSTTQWQWSTPGAENDSYTTQSPYLIYNKAGKYTVSLTITKSDNTTATATKDITVYPAQLPVADFTMAEATKNAGEQFSFVNRSTGANASFKWTFAGARNETLNTTNATAVYDVPGTYTVTLTATNSTGTSSQSKEVTVKAAAPTPLFSVNPSSIMLGETTYLVDKSRGTADKWLWTLDNHNHVTVINGKNSSFTPKHPGVYDITLSASNEVGVNSLTQKKQLYVSNADPKNALSFSGNEKVTFNCPLTTNSKVWSIEWWMNPTQYSGAGGFYTENGFANMHGIANGAYQVIFNNASLKSADGYIILNEWHHYAITFSLGTIKFYRDGVLFDAPSSKLNYTIGKWTGKMSISNSETPYKGLIDELHIWSKALTNGAIKDNANAPLKGDENGLMLYYNFNQGQGNVTDQTAFGNDGIREGFGPDGDAWPTTLGVFTLDLETSEAPTEDITSTYLTNYKRPFIYDDSKTINNYSANRFYALEQGTQNSTWQLLGATKEDDLTTGVHVDLNYNSDFCIATRYFGFGDEVSDHRAFQTVTLPAGKYTLSINSSSRTGTYNTSYLVANLGSELSTNETLTNSLAYTPLATEASIDFILGEETEVSLGVLYNLRSYARFNIQSFTLTKQAVEIIQANGQTSIYESVRNGDIQEAYGRDGGIMIASENKKEFRIYNAAGQCVFNDNVHGVHFLPFEKGVYIVNGQKVFVK